MAWIHAGDDTFTTAWTHPEGNSKHPPVKLRGKWNELVKLNFKDWEINAYNGVSGVFDGGSQVFSFKSSEGIKFSVMAANPFYWTSKDKELKRQVFYLLHNKRFYLIAAGGVQEKSLLKKLTQAREKFTEPDWNDPSDLDKLVDRLKSRESMFK